MTEYDATMSGQHSTSLAESTFVGRDHLVSYIATLVTRREHRLVTLTGPGGVGKTRLVIEVARAVRESFDDRVAFMRLSRVRNADLFGAVLEESLGIGQATHEAPLERSIRKLSTGRWLLVVDNFEHLPGAIPDLKRVVAACPEISVVVTSRVVPGVASEHIVQVPPLSSSESSLDAAASDPASLPSVRLYAERARMAVPGFRLTRENAADIARLCDRLGGLPLAIQLAASRSALFSPRDLLHFDGPLLDAIEPVSRRDHHQSSMHDTISWSLDLVSAEAREAAVWLSVLEGDFPFPIAQAHAGCTWKHVGELVDHHLLDPLDGVGGQRRFSMHELIRQYGQECLAHANLLDAAWLGMTGIMRDQVAALAQGQHEADHLERLNAIEGDMPNVRAALSWSLEDDQFSLAAALFVGLEQYWVQRSGSVEALFWMERVLSAHESGRHEVDERTQSQICRVAGRILTLAGRFDRSRLLLDKSIVSAEMAGDEPTIVAALLSSASLANQEGDRDTSERMLETAVAFVPTGSDAMLERDVQAGLGVAALLREDLRLAEDHLIKALVVSRRQGESSNIAGNLHYLGYAAALAGDYPRARLCLDEALAVHDPQPSRNRSWMLQARAWVDLLAREPHGTAPFLAEALKMRANLGDHRLMMVALHDTARAMIQTGNLASGAWLLGAGNTRTLLDERETIFSRPTIATFRTALDGLGEQAFFRKYNAGASAPPDLVMDTALTALNQIGPTSFSSKNRFGLTSRERDVLSRIAKGQSDIEIAEKLFISRDTAKTHARNILRKLGVSSRLAAVAVARREKLVSLDE